MNANEIRSCFLCLLFLYADLQVAISFKIFIVFLIFGCKVAWLKFVSKDEELDERIGSSPVQAKWSIDTSPSSISRTEEILEAREERSALDLSLCSIEISDLLLPHQSVTPESSEIGTKESHNIFFRFFLQYENIRWRVWRSYPQFFTVCEKLRMETSAELFYPQPLFSAASNYSDKQVQIADWITSLQRQNPDICNSQIVRNFFDMPPYKSQNIGATCSSLHRSSTVNATAALGGGDIVTAPTARSSSISRFFSRLGIGRKKDKALTKENVKIKETINNSSTAQGKIANPPSSSPYLPSSAYAPNSSADLIISQYTDPNRFDPITFRGGCLEDFQFTDLSPIVLDCYRDVSRSHDFKVRGPNYLKDQKKMHAGLPMSRLILMEVYEVLPSEGDRHDHISSKGRVNRRLKILSQLKDPPLIFVLNFQIPGDPPVSIVSYFALPAAVSMDSVRSEDENEVFKNLLEKFISIPQNDEDRLADWARFGGDDENGNNSIESSQFDTSPRSSKSDNEDEGYDTHNSSSSIGSRRSSKDQEPSSTDFERRDPLKKTNIDISALAMSSSSNISHSGRLDRLHASNSLKNEKVDIDASVTSQSSVQVQPSKASMLTRVFNGFRKRNLSDERESKIAMEKEKYHQIFSAALANDASERTPDSTLNSSSNSNNQAIEGKKSNFFNGKKLLPRKTFTFGSSHIKASTFDEDKINPDKSGSLNVTSTLSATESPRSALRKSFTYGSSSVCGSTPTIVRHADENVKNLPASDLIQTNPPTSKVEKNKRDGKRIHSNCAEEATVLTKNEPKPQNKSNRKQSWLKLPSDISWPDPSEPGALPPDDFRNQRFKLVPAMTEGPWIVLAAVSSKPALLGQKVVQRYFRAENYFEVDVHVGSSVIASQIVGLCRGYAKNFVCNIGVVIQGESTDELPEKLLACVAIHKIDVEVRRCLCDV